ncbi:MAG: glycosyltransferase, partial [Verrucomicrobiia bacterium]
PFCYEPPRPHSVVLEVMSRHDVLVLPSIIEGRALVQQEAMSVGVPVIATRNAGADDLIKDGETGFLVPPRDPEILAEKIEWCASHKKECREMGILAAERSATLTWTKYGHTILELLGQV